MSTRRSSNALFLIRTRMTTSKPETCVLTARFRSTCLVKLRQPRPNKDGSQAYLPMLVPQSLFILLSQGCSATDASLGASGAVKAVIFFVLVLLSKGFRALPPSVLCTIADRFCLLARPETSLRMESGELRRCNYLDADRSPGGGRHGFDTC